MNIRIFLDENTQLKEKESHEFPIVPRKGDTLRLPNGNEYTVEEVQWSLHEFEPAYPTLTVSEKHIATK